MRLRITALVLVLAAQMFTSGCFVDRPNRRHRGPRQDDGYDRDGGYDRGGYDRGGCSDRCHDGYHDHQGYRR